MTDTNVLWDIPRCTCGHHLDAHHRTPAGSFTWCSTWNPKRCDCLNYQPQPEEEPE